jgi:hypothetical protein
MKNIIINQTLYILFPRILHSKIIVYEYLPSITWLLRFYKAKCSSVIKQLLGKYLNDGT